MTLTEDLKNPSVEFEVVWGNSSYLSPRQAYAVATALGWWADTSIGKWLEKPSRRPLHEVAPFDRIDLRTMMHVGENRAWAALAFERCRAVAQDLSVGILPFERPGCYFDQLIFAVAVREAEDIWDQVESGKDDMKESESDSDWEPIDQVLQMRSHWPYLEVIPGESIRSDRHPLTWFDTAEFEASAL